MYPVFISAYDNEFGKLATSLCFFHQFIRVTSKVGDDVSNHQPHDCLLNRFSRRRSKKISASLAFVRGIHQGSVNSPHKRPVTRKMFPFDDVIIYSFRMYYVANFRVDRQGDLHIDWYVESLRHILTPSDKILVLKSLLVWMLTECVVLACISFSS